MGAAVGERLSSAVSSLRPLRYQSLLGAAAHARSHWRGGGRVRRSRFSDARAGCARPRETRLGRSSGEHEGVRRLSATKATCPGSKIRYLTGEGGARGLLRPQIAVAFGPASPLAFSLERMFPNANSNRQRGLPGLHSQERRGSGPGILQAVNRILGGGRRNV